MVIRVSLLIRCINLSGGLGRKAILLECYRVSLLRIVYLRILALIPVLLGARASRRRISWYMVDALILLARLSFGRLESWATSVTGTRLNQGPRASEYSRMFS